MGKAELARRFGVSRRTVYHWIETGQLDRDLDDAAVHYAPRPAVSRWLDAYRGISQVGLPRFGGRVVESISYGADHTSSFGFMDFVSAVNTKRGLTLQQQKCRVLAQ